ncbi:ABC transporter substrate-binding protein [candidate division WOR-3 bacterium]|nr:ABC transporter substrate-binding protein [candidate division WOR-3 bacterium]
MPSLTEIVYALEEEDRLIGVSNYCDYPPQAAQKEHVGDLISIDQERLIILNPDIILLSSPTQTQLAQDLKNAGFRIAMFPDPGDLEGVFAQIQSLADTLGVHQKGKLLVDSLRQVLSSIQAAESLSVYIEISNEPLMTVGSGSFLTDAFRRIGLYNIFADNPSGYTVISPEEVLSRSPQVIVFLYPGAAAAARIGWSNLPAVKAYLVFDSLPLDELQRPGPRLIAAIAQVSSIIHNAR